MTITLKCKLKNCTTDNIDHLRKGYCQKHYLRYKKHGDPLYVPPKGATKCKVNDCTGLGYTDRNTGEKTRYPNGYCQVHYSRLRNYGRLYTTRRVLGGKQSHQLSHTWYGMYARCYDKSHRSYKDYGGRGITICERWLNSFDNFVNDMGERPEGTTLDRIDVNGNYEPSNCRWATYKEQANNTRGNNNLTIGGVTKTVTQWAEFSPVTRGQIARRVKAGWSHKDAVFGKRIRKRWYSKSTN